MKNSLLRRLTLSAAASAAFFLIAIGGVAAQPTHMAGSHGWHHRTDPDRALLTDAYGRLSAELTTGTLGDVKLADLEKSLQAISVARQKYAYIKRSEALSFIAPGMGQFKNGAPLAGSLFLAGNIAVIGVTLFGAYALLPSDLQLNNLNWFTTPYSSVETAFESHTFVQYLPSMGVMLGGMIVDHVLRLVSANNAGALAREAVKSGKVTFEPAPVLVPLAGPNGRWGLGMGFGMRF